MSVLPYAAVRRMARHTWFHDPVFPFVHWPISGRADPPEHAGDNDWHFWVTARLRQGSQTRANDSAGLPGRDAGSHR
jgi:hypothetical protein